MNWFEVFPLVVFSRQNINSELSTSALGDPKVSSLPYGNFALRPQQVDAILHRAQRGTNPTHTGASSSELLNSTNAMTYLKFGLPRVTVQGKSTTTTATNGSTTPDSLRSTNNTGPKSGRIYGSRGVLYGNEVGPRNTTQFERNSRLRKSRSELDVRAGNGGGMRRMGSQFSVPDHNKRQYGQNNNGDYYFRDRPPIRSPSEGDLHRVVPHRAPMNRGVSHFDVSSSSAGYRSSPSAGDRRVDNSRYYGGQPPRSGGKQHATSSGKKRKSICVISWNVFSPGGSPAWGEKFWGKTLRKSPQVLRCFRAWWFFFPLI